MSHSNIKLDHIAARVRAHDPIRIDPGTGRHAAVAMVLTAIDLQVAALFIERARRDSDPWSGQMAFPGGIVEDQDADPRAAAERETLEEVGLRLSGACFMGCLDDMQGRHAGHPAGIVVSGFVYCADAAPRLRPNYEVAEALWVPLQYFLDPARYTTVPHPTQPEQRFPGVRVSDSERQVVWGLTRRFLMSFFDIVEMRFRG